MGVGGFTVVVIAEQDPEGGLRSPRKTRASAAGAVWSQTAGLAERPAVTRSGTEGSGGRRQAAVAVEQDGAPRWCAWIRLAVPPACGTLDAVSWTPGLPVCWLYCGVCQCPMGNRALPWESGKRGKDSCGASIPKACFGDVRSRRAIFMERSGKRVGQRGFMEDPRSACCRRRAVAEALSRARYRVCGGIGGKEPASQLEERAFMEVDSPRACKGKVDAWGARMGKGGSRGDPMPETWGRAALYRRGAVFKRPDNATENGGMRLHGRGGSWAVGAWKIGAGWSFTGVPRARPAFRALTWGSRMHEACP